MYFCTIKEFCSQELSSIYSEIDHSVDNRNREGLQKKAWDSEIVFLQTCFSDLTCKDYIHNGFILFEYYIPRLGKRPDVILLIKGIVFIIEFKVGEERGNSAQKRQTVGYAEALKYFHNRSWNRTIVPILVATESKLHSIIFEKNKESKIYRCIVCNKSNLLETINSIVELDSVDDDDQTWPTDWIFGQYDPNPSIIEATLKHYNSHDVKEIKETETSSMVIKNTSDFIVDKIAQTIANQEKAIFFVTGVPGAGKTLIGLEVVSKTHKEFKSVFLSGNDPLVTVLREALAEDTAKQEKYSKAIDPASFSGYLYKPTSMIQIIHGYRKATVEKISRVSETGEFILKEGTHPEVENVVVFDEAQRAWTREKLQTPGRNGKTTCLNDPHMKYSEPGFLIWSMNQKKGAVIICLVGGGQEINRGEAGLLEWFRSLQSFPDWKVYISKTLKEKEYGGEELGALLRELPNEIEDEPLLHLSVSKRSIRSENVSSFVKELLDGDASKARRTLDTFKDTYPIVITRDLQKAKNWIISQKNRKERNKSLERSGILMSSKAFRLRPYGYEPKIVGEYKKVATWFLGEPDNIESSDFMEVALSEFFVQGLELDWTIVMWDADFRVILDKNGCFNSWEYYGGFNGKTWLRNNTQKEYQLNAYRVLLTRARRGMAIFIPKGDERDYSRNPEWYDGIYRYLKSIGIKEI